MEINENKVGERLLIGPCSAEFIKLEECGRRKGVEKVNHKQKMALCPTETDALITCINKNPLYFRK